MTDEPARQFSELYGALYGRVRAYAARRVGADAADEVAAETFTIAWRRFEALWEAWYRLSEADREVLALVAWEELSVAEASRVLGCPAPVFSVRLHRARRRLERLLAQPAGGARPVSTLSEAS